MILTSRYQRFKSQRHFGSLQKKQPNKKTKLRTSTLASIIGVNMVVTKGNKKHNLPNIDSSAIAPNVFSSQVPSAHGSYEMDNFQVGLEAQGFGYSAIDSSQSNYREIFFILIALA